MLKVYDIPEAVYYPWGVFLTVNGKVPSKIDPHHWIVAGRVHTGTPADVRYGKWFERRCATAEEAQSYVSAALTAID